MHDDLIMTIKSSAGKLSQCFLQIVDVKQKYKKTEVMIFQRRAKTYDCNYYIGNEKIDIVQIYIYPVGKLNLLNGELDTVTRKGSSCSL